MHCFLKQLVFGVKLLILLKSRRNRGFYYGKQKKLKLFNSRIRLSSHCAALGRRKLHALKVLNRCVESLNLLVLPASRGGCF